MRPAFLKQFGIVVLALVCASPVWAARNAAMQACRSDFSKLCSGIKLGGGRAAECLKQHEAELTADCKATVVEIGDCGQEFKKICGTGSEVGALRDCVKHHAGEFSSSCLAVLPAR